MRGRASFPRSLQSLQPHNPWIRRRRGPCRSQNSSRLRRNIAANTFPTFWYKCRACFHPLPHFVIIALDAVPGVSQKYFFWSGESKPDSPTGDWQRALKGVFKEARIPDGHAHRFRDTFAVSLLQAAVPMERVSVLLGHSSIKVTEKHYSPWVRARREQLEADVRRTWDSQSQQRLTGSTM